MAVKTSRGRIPPESARVGAQEDSPDLVRLLEGLKGDVERRLERIGEII